MRLSIRAKLVALTVTLGLVFCGAAVGFSIWKGREALFSEIESRGLSVGQALASIAVEALHTGDHEELQRMVRAVQGATRDVSSVAICDAGGRVLADSARVRLDPDRPPDDFERRGLEVSRENRFVATWTDEALMIWGPVRREVDGGAGSAPGEEGELLGFVHVRLSLARTEAMLAEHFWTQLGVLGAIVYFMVPVCLVLAHRFARPIHEMVDITRTIAGGVFSARIRSTRRDELGKLAESINTMARSLETTTVSKDYVDKIIESIADSLIVLDGDERITAVNQPTLAILGRTEGEMIGCQLAGFWAPDRGLAEGELVARLTDGPIHDMDLAFRRRDGDTVPVSMSGSAIFARDGGIDGFVIMCTDITERKRAERAIEEARAAADAASEAKSRFLANMSHEIRTPMTAILGYAELLLEPGQSEDECRRAAGTIRRNGEHLLALLTDILDFSKLEAGAVAVERIPCSPWSICGDAVELMRARAESKGLELHLETVGPIPERIVSDPTRLRQILVNLVSNAVKFTERGEVRVVIALEESGCTRLRIDVIDTGIGLTEEAQRELFRPFQQADASTTRRYGGTGLGLSISRRLAGLLDGAISVRSAPGRGSTFSLLLEACEPVEEAPESESEPMDPLPAPRASAAQAGEPEPADAEGERPLEGVRVLIADDGPDNRRLLAFILEHAGALVSVAENGREAVDLIEAARADSRPLDVVLMDMQMPVMGGDEATRELRRRGFDRPIVALTANATADDREACLAAGCDAFVSKPIDRHALVALVRRTGTRRARPARS